MFALNKNLIQRYATNWIKEGQANLLAEYFYECTITFNPQYWSLNRSLNSVPHVIADVIKPVIRDGHNFNLKYSIEYHENNMPHIHLQLITEYDICPHTQQAIHMRLVRRYGRTQWYQTGQEDKFHDVPKMLWSEYLKKDLEKNQLNGLKHYFEYYYK